MNNDTHLYPPEDIGDLPEETRQELSQKGKGFVAHEIELDYEYWLASKWGWIK